MKRESSSSDARVAGGGGVDAVCAGGGCGAGGTEHERTGCGEHGVGSVRWVGHALRRKDGDLSKDTVKQELARKSST